MPVKKAHSSCLETIKPVRDALDVIYGKWKLSVIISVSVGNERFTDIQESIPGITPKVLAKELKELEQHEMISRIITEGYPVKVTYKATSYADTVWPIIHALKDWGLTHRKKIFSKQ